MDDDKTVEFVDEIRFINMVKNCKILYDRNAAKGVGWQSKICMTNKEWDRIAKAFGMPDKEFAIKKWRYFRDRFVREYRIRSKSPSGQLPSNFSPWIHYDHLKFLESHIRTKRNYYEDVSKSSSDHLELEFIDTENSTRYQDEFDNEDENEYINEISSTDYNNKTLCNLKYEQHDQELKPSTPTTHDKIVQSSAKKYDSGRKRKSPRRENDDDDDPEYSFALYVLAEMRQMPKRRRNQLKAMIVNFILNDENEQIEIEKK